MILTFDLQASNDVTGYICHEACVPNVFHTAAFLFEYKARTGQTDRRGITWPPSERSHSTCKLSLLSLNLQQTIHIKPYFLLSLNICQITKRFLLDEILFNLSLHWALV